MLTRAAPQHHAPQPRFAHCIPSELLLTLVTIADVGSFTRAGNLLGLTQSAISAQMKRLKQIVGGEVFERPGCCTLNVRGKAIERSARRILEISEQLLVFTGAQSACPQIRIGLPAPLAGALLGHAMTQCVAAAGGAKLQLRSASSRQLMKAVEDGYLDFAMVLCSREPPCELLAQWEEPAAWVCAPDLRVGPCEPFPLISDPNSLSDCIAIQALETAGLRYVVSFASEDSGARMAALRARLGYALMPGRVICEGITQSKDNFLPKIEPLRAGLCVREGFDVEDHALLLDTFEAAVRPKIAA